MKQRFFDVIKWSLIIAVAGVVIYLVYPKYYFSGPKGVIWYRCNTITGQVEQWDHEKGWETMSILASSKGD